MEHGAEGGFARHALRLVGALVTLAGLLATVSGLPAGAAAKPKTYNLSLVWSMPGFSDLPILAMVDQGIGHRFHLDLTIAATAPVGIQPAAIFGSGTGDLLVSGFDEVVNVAQHLNEPTTVIGTLDPHGLWTLVSRKGSPYRSLSSLRGTTVGIPSTGGFSQYALIQALHGAGMTPFDVSMAALGGSSSQYAALLGGSATAVELQPPTLQAALAAGTVQVVYDFEKVSQPSMLVAGRTAAVRSNPGAYAQFMRALTYTTNRLMSDRKWALQIAKAAFGSTVSTAQLRGELATYADNHLWSSTGKFTRTLYANGERLLAISGAYPPTGFPTYQELTAAAPRY